MLHCNESLSKTCLTTTAYNHKLTITIRMSFIKGTYSCPRYDKLFPCLKKVSVTMCERRQLFLYVWSWVNC